MSSPTLNYLSIAMVVIYEEKFDNFNENNSEHFKGAYKVNRSFHNYYCNFVDKSFTLKGFGMIDFINKKEIALIEDFNV